MFYRKELHAGKLNPKFSEGIFLGYSEDCPGYIVECKETGKLFTSRDVHSRLDGLPNVGSLIVWVRDGEPLAREMFFLSGRNANVFSASAGRGSFPKDPLQLSPCCDAFNVRCGGGLRTPF